MARFTGIDQRPRRLADEVYEQLLDGILSGTIEPGERLIQETLADELAVSRTPVREALLRLEREGILEPAAKRGYNVAEFTADKALNTYQARQAVEGFAARLVAEHASDETIERLRPVLQKIIDVSGFTSTNQENRDAHRALVEATGNDALLDLFDSLWERAMMLRIRSDVWFEGRLTHTHAEIWEAITARDGDRAHDAMVEHLQVGLELHMEAAQRHDGVRNPSG